MSDKLCQLEAQLVRDLGNRIGFGRMMQLAEEEWGDLLESRDLPRGGAHSTGPCVTFLVRCDHNGKEGHRCDWCCGAGRVTKRVAREMTEASVTQRDAEIEELREEVVGEMAITLKHSVSLQKASDEVARLTEELSNVRHDNKVLTARADSLGELLLASEESVQNRNKRIEELREERDAARAVLRHVQWDHKGWCIVCGCSFHTVDCALRAALGKDGE